MNKQQTLSLGISFGLLAVFLLVSMDTLGKWLSIGLPTLVVVWMRFVSPQLVVGAIMTVQHGPGIWRSKAPWLQAARSLSLACATCCLFFALRHLPLTLNAAIFYLAPFMVAGLAIPVLGERLSLKQWGCILGGMAGVLTAIGPLSALSGLGWSLLFAFGAALFTASYQLITRLVSRYDAIGTSQIYTTMAGCLVFAPFALMAWPDSIAALPLVILLTYGLLGGLAHWLMVSALSFTPAPIISPLFYSNILWVVLYDVLLFAKPPSVITLVGCGLIIAFGLAFFRLRHASD